MKTLPDRPGIWSLLRIWTGIGLQSFGGGASTTYLIYHMFVETYKWISAEEYNLYWNLSVMAPGINIVGMTILIGRKLGGARGVIAALAGLLVPSAAITCLLTAVFLGVERFPVTQAMLRGVIPATAGIMLVVGLKYGQPLFKTSHAEGFVRLSMSLLIALAALLALTVFQISVPLVLVGSALIGVLMFTRPARVTPIVAERSTQLEPSTQGQREEIHD